MRIIQHDTFPVFTANIRGYRTQARDSLLRADVLIDLQARVRNTMVEVADVIAKTRPLVVPMNWSMYPERVWNPAFGNVKPCVTISQAAVSWNIENWVNVRGESCIAAVTDDYVDIYASCRPCWEAYKRWGWEMIHSFEAAMLAVRQAYGLDWHDVSVSSTEYSWASVRYAYRSATPIEEFSVAIPEVEEYGTTYDKKTTKVFINFEFSLPTPPEEEKNAANCHVVTEEVEEVVKKTVKRMKCE